METSEETVSETSAANSIATIERICTESDEVKHEAHKLETVIKFLQGIFKVFDLPLKVMISGSAREHTRLSKESDIDIVIIPTHVVVSEDCIEYDRDKPCHVRMRADLAPDILRKFRHDTTNYISVTPLKNFERTDIFPAFVSWDCVRDLLNTPFNVKSHSFDLLTETKVGRLLRTIAPDLDVQEALKRCIAKRTVSENFLDDWTRTVERGFPSAGKEEFAHSFDQLISDPDILRKRLKVDCMDRSSPDYELNDSLMKISEIILGPFREWRQSCKCINSPSNSEPASVFSILVNYAKHLKDTNTRNTDLENSDSTAGRARLDRNDENQSPEFHTALSPSREIEQYGTEVTNCLPRDISVRGMTNETTIINTNMKTCPESPKQSSHTFRCVKSVDILPKLECSGKPRFFQEYEKRSGRLWPPVNIINDIVHSGFGLVCKYPSESLCPDLDFQLAFNEAEYILAENMSRNQKRCLRLLKYMKNKVTSCIHNPNSNEYLLTTYHIRTAFYWFSESVDEMFWERTPVMECARKVMVAFMFPSMRDGTMCHYFVPNMNVLMDIKDTTMNMLLGLWNLLHSDPLRDISSVLIDIRSGFPSVGEGSSADRKEIVISQEGLGNCVIDVSKFSVDGPDEMPHYDNKILTAFKDVVDDSIAVRNIRRHSKDDRKSTDKFNSVHDVLSETFQFIRDENRNDFPNSSVRSSDSLLKGAFHEMFSNFSSDCFVRHPNSDSNESLGSEALSQRGESVDRPSGIRSSEDSIKRMSKVLGGLSSGFGDHPSCKSLVTSCEVSVSTPAANKSQQAVSGASDELPSKQNAHLNLMKEFQSESKQHDQNSKEQSTDAARGKAILPAELSDVVRRGAVLIQNMENPKFDHDMKTFIGDSMKRLVTAFGNKLTRPNSGKKCEEKVDDIDLD